MSRKLYPILLLLALSSCRPAKYAINVSAGHDASEPDKGNFIKMKTGREVKLADGIEMASGMLEVDKTRMLKIGDKKYKGKEIGSLQISDEYYVNMAKNRFAKRIYHAPVNIFTSISTATYTETPSGSMGSMSGGGFGGGFGGGRTRTSARSHYFVQSPKIQKGILVQISSSGSAKELEPYLKDYKPSLDILKRYQQQRQVSRIVKFSTLGLWLSAIPMALLAKDNNTLAGIAGTNLVLGFIYVPAITFAFKSKNRARPYEAVQKYIDNNSYEDIPVATKAIPVVSDSVNIVADQPKEPNTSITADFIELNGNKIIVAESGTKLRSANNKIFTINNQKYTSGITAFQLNRKFYKKVSDTKNETDFAKRTLMGKISVYSFAKHSHLNHSTSEFQGNSKNLSFLNNNAAKEYYEKDNNGIMLSNSRKLHAFFEDNPLALGKYNEYVKHVRASKFISYSLLAATLASCVGVFTTGEKGRFIFIGTAIGFSVINWRYAVKQTEKLNTELKNVLNTYNGNKKQKIFSQKN